MATVTTKIEVGDPTGLNFQELQLEVDTGSNYSALPREMLQALGVPVEASVQSRLANGMLEMIEIIAKLQKQKAPATNEVKTWL